MRFTELSQWLTWLEQLHPKKIDLGLTRVAAVAERMQVQQFECPVMTIAGTNGKGSCVATLQAIYQQAGYRVGTYTSPHIFRFNERITLAGREASDAALCQAFAAIDAARAEISLSYFEFTTLAALYLFAHNGLDVILLEVGLGGRLDAVNIVDPDVALITSIDLEHQSWLGDTREKIAVEKAGIMRPHTPAVYGEIDMPVAIAECAEALAAPLYRHAVGGPGERAFCYQEDADKVTWRWQSAYTRLDALPQPIVSLQNATNALMVVELLHERLPVTDVQICAGLANIQLLARQQHIPGPIEYIIDVAHNPAAMRELARRLHKMSNNGASYAIVGMLNDKDLAASLAPLLPLCRQVFLADLSGAETGGRGASAMALFAAIAAKYQTKAHCCLSVAQALEAAQAKAQPGDSIIVCGSFHTVEAAMCCDLPGEKRLINTN